MSQQKRMQSIQQQVSPKNHVIQRVLQWQDCQSFEEIVIQTLHPTYDAEAKSVIDALKAQAKAAGKDKEPDVKQQLQKELNVLLKLSTLPMLHFEMRRYEWLYHSSQLTILNLWLVNQINSDCKKPETLRAMLNQWVRLYISLNGFNAWVDYVSQTWMDGVPLLLKEHTVLITEQLDKLEQFKESMGYLGLLMETPVSFEGDTLEQAINQEKEQWLERMQHELQVHLLECQGKEEMAVNLERQWLKDQLST